VQTIWAIIDEADGLEYSGFLIVENPLVMRLMIEALREHVPVDIRIAHHGGLNGDAMRDPEICAEM
jgi:hypothetical protein